jgi:hypothetical protein
MNALPCVCVSFRRPRSAGTYMHTCWFRRVHNSFERVLLMIICRESRHHWSHASRGTNDSCKKDGWLMEGSLSFWPSHTCALAGATRSSFASLVEVVGSPKSFLL